MLNFLSQPHTFKRRYPKWMIGKPLLYASSALASLGDAMFGYSQGVIAVAQVQPSFIRRMYGPNLTLEQIQAGNTGVNPLIQAIVVSCLNLTALIASIASSYLCDHLGRRLTVRLGAFIYLLSALIQIFMPNLTALLIGRCIQGLGVGILSTTVPILQCEIAPPHSRGLFVSLEYLFLNAGYALSAWVGYAFFFAMPSELSWRGPYIVQAALACTLFAWTFYLPETPRWLVQHGQRAAALQVLADLHGTGDVADPAVRAHYLAIERTIVVESSERGARASWKELVTLYPRRVLVGVTCQLFAQTNGVNAVLYYLPENLTRAGFSVQRALLYSGACALVYCAGTVPTMLWVDRWGRRKFLLVGSVGLAAALAVVGGLQLHVRTLPIGEARLPDANGIFAAICVYLFVFGASWGPVPWLLGAEIFPIRARAKGMALSTSTNWIFNFVLAFVTPPLFKVIDGGFYFILVASCLTAAQVVWLWYPETAGKTLEELGEVFGDSKVLLDADEKGAAAAATVAEDMREGGEGGFLGLPAPSLMPASEETLAPSGTDTGSQGKLSVSKVSLNKL